MGTDPISLIISTFAQLYIHIISIDSKNYAAGTDSAATPAAKSRTD